MTSRSAASAGRGFNEFQRQAPFAERDLVRHQFRVRTAMHHMAGFAALAAVLPVDVDKMQIPGPVPESGGIVRRGILQQVAVMTSEAELEFSVRIRHVELRRVCSDQEHIV